MEIKGKISILKDVPEGKQQGICEWPGQTDGGTAVFLLECANSCAVAPGCYMFGNGEIYEDGTMTKYFTPNPPQY